MSTSTIDRDWLNVGAGFTGDENKGRERVSAEIQKLTWKDVPQDGSPLSLPFSPGEGIKAAIEQLEIPKVQRVATDGYLQWPDGPETAHYSIYGIEGLYRDYRVQLFILDTGTGLIPLAADKYPREES